MSVWGIDMTPTKEQLADPKWWNQNAPEGATHWVGPTVYPWEKHEDDKRFVWISNNWLADDNGELNLEPVEDFDYCIPRPTQPQWAREGLPPVGWTHKECRIAGVDSDDKFEIVAHRNGYAIVVFSPVMEGGNIAATTVSPEEFEPIRTQAEIEREEVVKAGISIWESDPDAADDSWIKLCERLYDAGMLRKPMSRDEAFNVITGVPRETPLLTQHVYKILDALGYKD